MTDQHQRSGRGTEQREVARVREMSPQEFNTFIRTDMSPERACWYVIEWLNHQENLEGLRHINPIGMHPSVAAAFLRFTTGRPDDMDRKALRQRFVEAHPTYQYMGGL